MINLRGMQRVVYIYETFVSNETAHPVSNYGLSIRHGGFITRQSHLNAQGRLRSMDSSILPLVDKIVNRMLAAPIQLLMARRAASGGP